jgi:hypothetical protein
MKDEAHRRVREAASDARSGDDMVGNGWDEPLDDTPSLDEPTLDEQHSTQLGEMWDPRRRGAN